MKAAGCAIGPISGGCFTALVTAERQIICDPVKASEGEVIGDLDFAQIDAGKKLTDARAHCSRPEVLSLLIDRTPAPHIHGRTTRLPAAALRTAVDEEKTVDFL